eukprot:TRINITY_DN14679_c0_g1_i3.p1 TRINITY_DN14679_c0_g1~~TRINITY_DN14679_c0_g1_i3.p1  ORF type:complete len:195 (+),score=65.83 TRINITY_DN14679_c0_g1_i3:21-605(+)
MSRRPTRSTLSSSSAASDVYKRQVLAVRGMFARSYTVEVDPMLFAMARTRGLTEGAADVSFMLGDSTEVIKKQILPKEPRVPICWFLDGHFSGGATGHNGTADVPLLEELRAIAEAWEGEAHVIVIDDAHLFGTTHAEDWGHVTVDAIVEAIGAEKVAQRLEQNNRLVLVLKAAEPVPEPAEPVAVAVAKGVAL